MKPLTQSLARIGMKVLETEMRSCAKHGEYESRRTQVGAMSVDWSECPKCRDEADRARELQERQQREAEMRKRKIEALLNRAAIPPRFKGRTFENYVAQNEGQARALSMCSKYAEDFDAVMRDGRCLVLSGKPGTGKTHLAIAIARAVIAAGRSAMFVGALEAIKTIRATWGAKATQTEEDVMFWYRDVDLLILDEVGTQFGSEAEQVQIFEIINYRYMDMKPTIIISNLDAGSIEGVLGQRAMDRLRENGGRLIPFDWESRRGKA